MAFLLLRVTFDKVKERKGRASSLQWSLISRWRGLETGKIDAPKCIRSCCPPRALFIYSDVADRSCHHRRQRKRTFSTQQSRFTTHQPTTRVRLLVRASLSAGLPASSPSSRRRVFEVCEEERKKKKKKKVFPSI